MMRKTERSRIAPLGSVSFSMGSFNISAADDSASNPPEVDPNIPGVCLGKKSTRRKRVPQIKVRVIKGRMRQYYRSQFLPRNKNIKKVVVTFYPL